MAERRPGWAVWVATGGGVGNLPVAPGTAGSALGVGLMVGLRWLPFEPPLVWAASAGAVLFILGVGVWSASRAEAYFGRTDPEAVVVDEVAGQMLALLASPGATWKGLLAGFVLFRLFDVFKPFPARRLERRPGGWGIMLDDVAAGAYSGVTLWALGHWMK